MTHNKHRRQSGQAVIEFAGTMGVLVATVPFLLVVFIAIQNSMVVRHALYEAAVCSQLYPEVGDCEQQMRDKIEKSLVVSTLKKSYLRVDNNSAAATAILQTPLTKKSSISSWTLTENIALPLTGTP